MAGPWMSIAPIQTTTSESISTASNFSASSENSLLKTVVGMQIARHYISLGRAGLSSSCGYQVMAIRSLPRVWRVLTVLTSNMRMKYTIDFRASKANTSPFVLAAST